MIVSTPHAPARGTARRHAVRQVLDSELSWRSWLAPFERSESAISRRVQEQG
jgi:hypothetical protein